MMKILHVVGARPNFMKIARIVSPPPFDRLRTELGSGMREMARHPGDSEQIASIPGREDRSSPLIEMARREGVAVASLATT